MWRKRQKRSVTTKIVGPKNVRPQNSALEEAADLFKKGGIIAYPTETVYGLGADPFREKAVRKLFKLKGRERGKPVSLLIKDFKMLSLVAKEVPPLAKTLIKNFWPGPLTIIFKAKKTVPATITGSTGTIAVRISSNPLAKKLLALIDSPVTTTSANPAGKKSSLSAKEVSDYFGAKVDFILDGGRLSGKLGSTIVDVSEGEPVVIREGDLPIKKNHERPQKGWSIETPLYFRARHIL